MTIFGQCYNLLNSKQQYYVVIEPVSMQYNRYDLLEKSVLFSLHQFLSGHCN